MRRKPNADLTDSSPAAAPETSNQETPVKATPKPRSRSTKAAPSAALELAPKAAVVKAAPAKPRAVKASPAKTVRAKVSALVAKAPTDAPTETAPKAGPRRATRTPKAMPAVEMPTPVTAEAPATAPLKATTSGRRSAISAKAVPPATSPGASPTEAPKPARSRSRRSSRSDAPAPDASTEVLFIEPDDFAELSDIVLKEDTNGLSEPEAIYMGEPSGDVVQDDLPMPRWRVRQERSPKSGRGVGRREPRTTPVVAAPEVAPDESEPEEATDGLAPRRSRRRRRKDRVDMDITAAAALGTSEDGDDTPTETAAPTERTETETNRSGRGRSRGDRERTEGHPRDLVGRNRTPRPTPEEEVPQEVPGDEIPVAMFRRSRVKPPKPPVVVAPRRQPVPVPADAPQVVDRNGIPTLVRQGIVYPPLAFFGSSSDERRLETVMKEIAHAATRGVKLFSHFVELDVDPSKVDDAVRFAGFLLKRTLAVAPEAQVIFRVVFTAPEGWERKFPNSRYITEDGSSAEPSFCDDTYWEVAERCLRQFVETLRLLDDQVHILGVHLERGEWFFSANAGYDTSVAAHEKFRDWVRTRYRDDVVALRASWFDGQVQFETISVPEYGRQAAPGEVFVRTGRKARRWVDYHLFLSDAVVERISQLAHSAKEASQGYFLVGASYGYSFEWGHPASGHLSLGKLLREPALDFIAGPPSYKSREPGGTAPFPGPIDSIALNGKLYLSEEDYKTPIGDRAEPDDYNPPIRTPQALESVHWRGVGAALAHGAGVCWMDTWGNGWLDMPGIWQRGEEVLDAFTLRQAAPMGEPDVAVFIDERSLAYLVDQDAFSLLVQNVREAILRSGLSAGFYLLSDLAHRERFPESKLYVFMNAWDIRPEVRSAIKTRLQRDHKVLFWLYAAGLFEAGRDSLERVREVTGIALKPQPFASKPGTTLLNRRHPLTEALPEKVLAGGGRLEPSYFAIPEDGVLLGEYTQTGLPSFIVRDIVQEGHPELSWRSVFLGEPIVTPALFRALGQMAGAHVWGYHDDVIHVRPPFLTIHAAGGGNRTVALPDKWSAYDLRTSEWSAVDTTHVRFATTDGATSTFLVGPQVELETLIATDPSQVLHMAELPPRPENTLHLDSVLFDVPIMKLDEWIEEDSNADDGDDLLFRTSALDLDAEPEPEDAVVETFNEGGRSGRRRRRRPRNGRGSEEVVDRRSEGADRYGPSDPGDITLNVVFRRRE